jgi:hypothetical protein
LVRNGLFNFFFKQYFILNSFFNFTKIDLQWMVLSCDPTKPERDSCDELPVSKGEQINV